MKIIFHQARSYYINVVSLIFQYSPYRFSERIILPFRTLYAEIAEFSNGELILKILSNSIPYIMIRTSNIMKGEDDWGSSEKTAAAVLLA